MAKGKDPVAERKLAVLRQTDRVEDVADEFIKRRILPRQARAGRETESLIQRRIVGPWKGRRIGDIRRADVDRILDMELDAGRDRTANKLLAVTRRLFNFSMERYELEKNPALGIERPGVERSRDRVLDDTELAAIWHAAGELGWPAGPFVRVLLLTAQRRSEVAGMRWQDIELDQAVWTLPVTKSKRAHLVPLSDLVVAILHDAPVLTHGDRVFWTGRNGLINFGHAKVRLDKLSGVTDWRFHDLRRSAATGMAKLGVQPHVLAAVLNHAPASVQNVTAIYNRFRYEKEKRQALDMWAETVLGLAEGKASKVVALRQ